MLISAALDRYVLQLQADGRSEHTINQAQRHVRLLDAWFGEDREVETIAHEDLARFLTSDVVRCRADGKPRPQILDGCRRCAVRQIPRVM